MPSPVLPPPIPTFSGKLPAAAYLLTSRLSASTYQYVEHVDEGSSNFGSKPVHQTGQKLETVSWNLHCSSSSLALFRLLGDESMVLRSFYSFKNRPQIHKHTRHRTISRLRESMMLISFYSFKTRSHTRKHTRHRTIPRLQNPLRSQHDALPALDTDGTSCQM